MKKFTTKLLMFAMVLTGISVLSSCKDYDEDHYFEQTDAQKKLQEQVVQMQTKIEEIKNIIINSNCTCATWTPGADGFWYKDGEKTELPCKGTDGTNGTADKWTIGEDGFWYLNGEKTEYVAVGTNGTNGTTPTITIDENGYWVINGVPTEIKAKGEDGQNADVWEIGEDGHWYLNGVDQGWSAVGQKGEDGKGLTPEQEAAINQIILLHDKIQETAEMLGYADEQDMLEKMNEQILLNKIAIAEAQKAIEDLKERVEALEEEIKKLITGITIQGTENPVFGSIALPAGVSSKVLMAFYGKADNDIAFPTSNDAYYVWKNEVLTDKEAEMIGAGALESFFMKSNETLINDEGNAGKLYLTVNPAGKDYTGVDLTLENSQMKSAGITLSPLRPSDKTLTFGYTRGIDNGFFEADATIEDIDAVQKVNLNLSKYKDIVKDIINNKQNFNITKAAQTIYDQFNGILDANAVKAEYTVNDETRSIYSDYGVAATAVKPLSYAFAKDFSISAIPGYYHAVDVIDRIASSIIDPINDQLESLNIDITELNHVPYASVSGISWDDVDENKLLVEITIPLDDDMDIFEDMNGYLTIRINGTNYPVEVGQVQIIDGGRVVLLLTKADIKPQVQEIFGAIDNALEDAEGDLNKVIENINEIIDEINKIDINISGIDVDFVNDIKHYLDRINDATVSLVNKATKVLQPCMLVMTNNKMSMGSASVNYPTYVESTDVTLIPTSYNYEVITPAFKKHVACVNVIKNGASAQAGDGACKAELNRVNGQETVNTVLDGDCRRVNVNLKSGYTYQFAYSAVDYSGKVSTKRVAVRVK